MPFSMRNPGMTVFSAVSVFSALVVSACARQPDPAVRAVNVAGPSISGAAGEGAAGEGAAGEGVTPGSGATPARIILFIADGTGVAQWTTGLLASGALAVDEMPHTALIDTRSADGRVTDSSASATAYAAGVTTENGFVGLDVAGESTETVLERMRAAGGATGVVVTSSVVHATPASFMAEVRDRWEYETIARQIAAAPPDVLLGGGRRYFDPDHREDGADLLASLARGHTVIVDAAEFATLGTDTIRALVGLFVDEEPPPAADRKPRLAALTTAALDILDQRADRFFLLVEGSQIDWTGHDNESFDAVAAEVVDLDAAIEVALDYADRAPGTLVVVTSDHETGGLALEREDGDWIARWATGHHTGELVPLFAVGPGAERFHGIMTNAEVGRTLLGFVAPVAVPANATN